MDEDTAVSDSPPAPIRIHSTSSKISGSSPFIKVSIPTKSGEKLILSRPAESGGLSVGLPRSSSSQSFTPSPVKPPVVDEGNGTVRYNGVMLHTDVRISALDDSAKIEVISLTPSAPRRFSFPVDVPTGGSMQLQEDGNVAVFDGPEAETATMIGGFSPPYAYDADGNPVQTRFEISVNNLVQVIEPSDTASYPITSDPWLWRDLIKSAAWAYHNGYGFTFMVTPTKWQRGGTGYYPARAGWNELYKKYRNRGLNTNLDGMKDQYMCHVQVVAVRSPRKPTWNLDEWRPNVSYAQTINANCNPGGTKWFD